MLSEKIISPIRVRVDLEMFHVLPGYRQHCPTVELAVVDND